MKYTILCLALSGCAQLPPGLTMTDADRQSCATEGCTTWTESELHKLILLAIQKGIDAAKRRGNSI